MGEIVLNKGGKSILSKLPFWGKILPRLGYIKPVTEKRPASPCTMRLPEEGSGNECPD